MLAMNVMEPGQRESVVSIVLLAMNESTLALLHRRLVVERGDDG